MKPKSLVIADQGRLRCTLCSSEAGWCHLPRFAASPLPIALHIELTIVVLFVGSVFGHSIQKTVGAYACFPEIISTMYRGFFRRPAKRGNAPVFSVNEPPCSSHSRGFLPVSTQQ
ncbi:hypothetical protein KSP40_PGU008841 [Platanthera guangdongensis]|uniref:Uncharacterized protein n=1 Tax=Platanthera guangdongensis TaxID=2320717 RepID=A0ABR2N1B4_9ASPA